MTCFAVFKNDRQIRVFSFDFGSYRDRDRAKQKAFHLAYALFDSDQPVLVSEFTSTGRIGLPVLTLQKTE